MRKAREEYKKLPSKHFEISLHETIPNTSKKLLYGAEFNPQRPRDRVKMYEPVNECDT